MTDHKLLVLAAKAAGAHDVREVTMGVMVQWSANLRGYSKWNPLIDDGDALRLAVKIRLYVTFSTAGDVLCGMRHGQGADVDEPCGLDPHAATRRAIVRAAAEIGRNMP